VSTIRLPSYLSGRARMQWHRMKCAGKRYARWMRIRPELDPIGDNSQPRFLSKTRAKLSNRNHRRKFGNDES
jgi:hypothetical protein